MLEGLNVFKVKVFKVRTGLGRVQTLGAVWLTLNSTRYYIYKSIK